MSNGNPKLWPSPSNIAKASRFFWVNMTTLLQKCAMHYILALLHRRHVHQCPKKVYWLSVWWKRLWCHVTISYTHNLKLSKHQSDPFSKWWPNKKHILSLPPCSMPLHPRLLFSRHCRQHLTNHQPFPITLVIHTYTHHNINRSKTNILWCKKYRHHKKMDDFFCQLLLPSISVQL